MSISKLNIRNMVVYCLLVIQLLPVASAEVPLAAFEANYELFYGKMKAAKAQISLSQTGDNWRWRLRRGQLGADHAQRLRALTEAADR